ncbi:hypothetical protein JFL43_06635 [Viridibacillus sp. YIM B01967]|uniref:Aspartyl/asparaginyl-tRNA synthetase n=1 Tax=Viridibacillus soli TaxID=2798301 RepID=A0ABS1H536_9BACL|nr:hypothetical protein [Viridibacillus soli]MBK3494533.1 hypothetical protein [Viridibacillus soli]
MNVKNITGVLVGVTSILALYFIIKQNFNVAILFITLMFTVTNTFRAKDFKDKGYEKEAKWMRGMAIFFGIATLAILVVNFM